MPTLVVGMLRTREKLQHAHDKRGHGADHYSLECVIYALRSRKRLFCRSYSLNR